MARSFTIKFRGEDIDVTPSNNGTEWHFDGLTTEQYNALNVTGAEEDEICSQLMDKLYEDALCSYPDER